MNERTKFIIYALGVFFCYFYYGIIQEKITRGRYGNEVNPDGTVGDRFTYIMALIWIQCICSWIFAKAMLSVRPQKEDTTHAGYYASCSLTYLLAMVSSNMALRWVPYPTQVIGKSAKPIPVMILGVLIGRKTYSLLKYLCVIFIVIGVVLFMYKEDKATTVVIQDRTYLGELLLFLSLSMDGLTGAVQERIRAASSPSGQQMMLAMNWWSSIILGVSILITGECKDFIAFATKHPSILVHLSTFAVASALGQLFIFLMVTGFGPLACATVTTTRKFFTVLCSVIFFGNTLNTRQWMGTIIVFSALFIDTYYGKKPPVKITSISKHDETIKKKEDDVKETLIK